MANQNQERETAEEKPKITTGRVHRPLSYCCLGCGLLSVLASPCLLYLAVFFASVASKGGLGIGQDNPWFFLPASLFLGLAIFVFAGGLATLFASYTVSQNKTYGLRQVAMFNLPLLPFGSCLSYFLFRYLRERTVPGAAVGNQVSAV